jgi:hypothetical protein
MSQNFRDRQVAPGATTGFGVLFGFMLRRSGIVDCGYSEQ